MSEQEALSQHAKEQRISEGEHISEESLEDMKQETWRLIRQFCTPTNLGEWNWELRLHDSTRIKFTEFQPVEVDVFCGLVREFAEVLYKLIRNLSSESELRYAETEYVTGSIDFEKTRVLRQAGGSELVCIEYSKNMFTPENVLLAALILGINTMARTFLAMRDDWKETEREEGQVEKLNGIISYTSFLQRDRFVSKLARYYLENFQGIEQLIEKTSYRIRTGKLRSKYRPLLQFIKYWFKYNQILQEGNNSLNIKLAGLTQFKTGHKIYEIWTFYKILSIFFGEKEVQQKSGSNYEEFTTREYAIKYQFGKQIGWKHNGTELTRRPDTAIKKHGKAVAMFDAKYSSTPPNIESDEEEVESETTKAPKTVIVNQMIIAMDYGKERVDLGFVLFADKEDQKKDIIIEKSSGVPTKKIYFLNMHPENHPIDALNKVKQICDLK